MSDSDTLKMRMGVPYRSLTDVSETKDTGSFLRIRDFKRLIKNKNVKWDRFSTYNIYKTYIEPARDFLYVHEDKIEIGEEELFNADTEEDKILIKDIYKHARHQAQLLKQYTLIEWLHDGDNKDD